MTLTIGIDVGGTKIAGGVVDEGGVILAEATVVSPADDTDRIEQTIVALVQQLRAGHEVEAVGVGMAGYIDSGRSVVMFTPNLALRDVPLRADLEAGVGLPVVVENDANAAAWGEFAFGAGADVDDLLLLTIGTGVGGGIVLGGDLLRGAFGVAAEVGHLRMVPGGHPCGCGNRGCFEQYASGSALVRNARQRAIGGSPESRPLVTRAGGDPTAVTGPMVTELAGAGDPFCVDLLAELGRWLGEGIAALATVLDPAVTVIGGGVSQAGDLLVEPARQAFLGEVIAPEHRPIQAIRPARLGNRAGIIGAADLARR
ncbi:ROK family glucokinase [Nocardioides sp.]|uniref:ROK family glucokinase n=1 Tax=Nocardioides sp. TaxID=35761 RepID=UPI00352766BF